MRTTWTKRLVLTSAAAALACVAASGLAGDGPGVAPADRFVVHEWGTFTSVQGQEGIVLEGLSREEESLPSFVYSRTEVRDCPLRAKGWKGLEVPPTHVTQKMETPVLYFHSATARRARVRVDFVGGLISQWYPVSDLLGPPEGARSDGALDLSKVDRSFLQWDIDVLPQTKGAERPAQVPDVADGDPWAFARDVDASWIRTLPRKGPDRAGPVEAERYLFYRGLGRFAMPLDARMYHDDDVVIFNHGTTPIEGTVVFEVRGDKGRMTTTEAIKPDGAVKAILSDDASWGPVADVEAKLKTLLQAKLTKQGLNADEALAMVRTWSRSWFRSEGTRVLWIVPRPAVDALLPLSIDPKPDEIVRVLVGRAEVIPPRVAEEDWKALLDSIDDDKPEVYERLKPWYASRGRFLEPHMRNVLAMIDARAGTKAERPEDKAVRERAASWVQKFTHGEEVFTR